MPLTICAIANSKHIIQNIIYTHIDAIYTLDSKITITLFPTPLPSNHTHTLPTSTYLTKEERKKK